MTAHLVRGDARRLPLSTGSVQCVVTSPPYFGLRSYGGQSSVWGGDPDCPHSLEDGPALKPMTGGTGPTSGKQTSNKGSQFGNAWAEESGRAGKHNGWDGNNKNSDGTPRVSRYAGIEYSASSATCTRCGAWRGELGSEPDVAMFVSHLVEVFRECRRVMRDDAVLFCNIGDSFSGSGKGPSKSLNKANGHSQGINSGYVPVGTRPKSLLLVPERLAIALADDGWVIRSRIAWCKAAPMPESVDDRPTSAWEHIWQLTKSNKALFWTHRDGDGTRTQPAPDYRWQLAGVELTEEPEDAKENGWKRVNLWRGHDYYWDADAVREPNTEGSLARQSRGIEQPHHKLRMEDEAAVVPGVNRLHCGTLNVNGLHNTGANMRNFWLLGPDPYSISVGISRERRVPADAADDDTRRITSPDCPLHAGLPDQESTAQRGGRVGASAESRRSQDTRNGLAQAPLFEPAPTDQPHALGSAAESSDSSPLPCAPVATGHSNGIHRTDHAPETSQPCTASAESPADTARSEASHESLASNDCCNPERSETPGDTLDIGACTCSYVQHYTEKSSHFATFPREIPRRCILAATSEYGACAACGAAWRRVVERESGPNSQAPTGTSMKAIALDESGYRHGDSSRRGAGTTMSNSPAQRTAVQQTTTGWTASCKCGPAAGVRPCVVADVFSGSGTTAFVAASLGRVGIGVELSESYTKQARYGRLAQQFLPLAAHPQPAALRLPFEAEVTG